MAPAAMTGLTIKVESIKDGLTIVEPFSYTCTTPEKAAQILVDTMAELAPGQKVVGIEPVLTGGFAG